MIFSYLLNMQSHPSWVCGLKHVILDLYGIGHEVTPFVGVWIETSLRTSFSRSSRVTPFVGVWIETEIIRTFASDKTSHTLRGCVD